MEMLANQVAIAVENSRLYDKLRESFEQTLLSLIVTIEKRDPYTGGHTQRVYAGCVAIANQMDAMTERMDHLRLGALLHDIGKIGILDSVLRHPGPLNEKQWQIMKTHPTTGVEILQHITGLADISPIVLHHHERWDGLGYPSKLSGEKIPLESRIIAVADAYDAMTSTRPYRDCLGHEAAVNDIQSLAGSQFDPMVVDAFLKAVSNGAFPLEVE
jgi:putative nucleotidyltransferase with HDIG domain